MPAKKIFVALLIIVVAIGGFVAGLILLRERQELREQAAVPGGQAEVSISPETGTYNLGDTIQTSIHFNPANIPISGVAIRLSYPFTGTTPEVSVSRIEVNPVLLSSGEWTCPTQDSYPQGGNMIIDIGCANISSGGFVSNSDTLLANVDLKIDRAVSVSPLLVKFDNVYSVITRRSDNQDILLIPTSSGTYNVPGGAQITEEPTAAPTSGAVSGSPTPTRRLTVTPTSTSTSAATLTPTKAELPESGVSYPTIFGLGLGSLVIIAALLLAL